MEGRCLRLGQDPRLLHADLDPACGDVRVDRFSRAHSADSRDDKFRAHLLCLGKILRPAVCLLVDQLNNTAPVAEVYEHKSAFVPLLGHPSHNGDGLPYIRFTQFSAPACAL